MAKILVVDDEKVMVKGIRFNLENEGYTVDVGYNGRQAVDLARANDYDLIILDLMMPEMDGLEACMEIRSFSSVPIIMLTARSQDTDKLLGFEYGADDYITKPFGVMELVSRVKAVLRRCRPQPAAVLRCGGLVVDEQEHTVTADGVRVVLTYKEYQLLRLFLSHPGTAFTRDQLMEQVWGMDFYGESRTVDMHIRTLRQKLGVYGEYIETVRSVGYRWRAQP